MSRRHRLPKTSKKTREVIASVEAVGFTFARKGGHGLVFKHPNGASVTVDLSPEHRAAENTVKRAQRRAINPSAV